MPAEHVCQAWPAAWLPLVSHAFNRLPVAAARDASDEHSKALEARAAAAETALIGMQDAAKDKNKLAAHLEDLAQKEAAMQGILTDAAALRKRVAVQVWGLGCAAWHVSCTCDAARFNRRCASAHETKTKLS